MSFLLDNGFDFNVITPCAGVNMGVASTLEIIMSFAPEQVENKLKGQVGYEATINILSESRYGTITSLTDSIKQLKSILESTPIGNANYYSALTSSLLYATKGKQNFDRCDFNGLITNLIAAGADVSKVQPIRNFLRTELLEDRYNFVFYRYFLEPATKYVHRDLRVFFKSMVKLLIVNDEGGDRNHIYIREMKWIGDIVLRQEGKNLEVISALTNALIELHNEYTDGKDMASDTLFDPINHLVEHMKLEKYGVGDLGSFFKSVAQVGCDTADYQNKIKLFIYVILKNNYKNLKVISALTNALIELHNKFHDDDNLIASKILFDQMDHLFIHMMSPNFKEKPELANLIYDGISIPMPKLVIDCITKLNQAGHNLPKESGKFLKSLYSGEIIQAPAPEVSASRSLAARFFDGILWLFRLVGSALMQLFNNKSSNDVNVNEVEKKTYVDRKLEQKVENNKKIDLDEEKKPATLFSSGSNSSNNNREGPLPNDHHNSLKNNGR